MCNKLIKNIISNSSSYLIIVTSYIISVFELWDEKTNGELWKNILRTIILLAPQIFAVLEINNINILFCCCSKKLKLKMLIIKQEKLLSELKEVNFTLNNALLLPRKYKKFSDSYLKQFNECKKYIKEIKRKKKKQISVFSRKKQENSGKNGKKKINNH